MKENIPLAPYTTFGIGGPAEYFATAKSEDELKEAVQFAKEKGLKVIVLGGGSNVLVADEGVHGLVIKNEIDGIAYTEEGDDVLVTAGAGVVWDELVAEMVEKGLWGLENLSGIPGTVGGAVVQNINAYGVTIAEVVERVEAMHTETGTIESFTKEQGEFEYRNSFFKRGGMGKKYVVTSVLMRLSRGGGAQIAYRSASSSIEAYLKEKNIDNPSLQDMRSAILSVRTRIGMIGGIYKSAGSFFTNAIVSRPEFERVEAIANMKYPDNVARLHPWHWPLPDGREKISAAFLMECTPYNKSAFLGKTFQGSVGISPLHTLSLINTNGARASDVKDFADLIAAIVREEFDVSLESEICFL